MIRKRETFTVVARNQPVFTVDYHVGYIATNGTVLIEPITVRARSLHTSCVPLFYSDLVALWDSGVPLYFDVTSLDTVRRVLLKAPGDRLKPLSYPPSMADLVHDALLPSKRLNAPLSESQLVGVCAIAWVYARMLSRRRPPRYDPDSNLEYCLKIRERFEKLLYPPASDGIGQILTRKRKLLDHMETSLKLFFEKMAVLLAPCATIVLCE